MELTVDQRTKVPFEASTEKTCPECGQSLEPMIVETSWRSQASSWWPWILVGLGLYLVLVFYGEMQSDAAFLPSPDFQAACSQPPPIRSVNPKLCERFVQDRQLYEHDEAAVAVGVVVLFLGVVRLVRQSLAVFQFSRRADPAERTKRHRWQPLLATALAVWILGERLLLLGFQCLLVVAGATLIVSIVGGAPFSVDLVNAAIGHAVDAAFVLKLMVS